MRVGFFEAWSGRKHKASACPNCLSVRVRYSQRSYAGLSALIFRVKPVKCLDCGTYFAVAGKRATPSDLNLAELNIAFRPEELDREPTGGATPDAPPSSHRHSSSRPRARKCPVCGSHSARPARWGPPVSSFRLDAREYYRCSTCNGSFTRTSPLRLVALLMVLSSALGVIGYLINRVRPGSTQNPASPRLRQNQVPKVEPPVFK